METEFWAPSNQRWSPGDNVSSLSTNTAAAQFQAHLEPEVVAKDVTVTSSLIYGNSAPYLSYFGVVNLKKCER